MCACTPRLCPAAGERIRRVRGVEGVARAVVRGHPQRGGSGLTGRPPRRGEGPTPSPLHAPHRASVAPTAHLQRALPSDRPPDADGCRVARCSPGGEPPARYRTVAQLSNSHTRRRARRSSVSTRSRAIGSGSTLGVGGWGVPGGRSRGPRWSRPPPVTSARRQPWWWTATIPARPHPARRARPPDHPRPGPAPARCTTGRCSCARSSPGEFWRVSRREQRLTEASAGSSDRVEEWVTLD